NGFFESSTDELIAEQGQSNQKKTNIDNLKPFTFKVPDDAVTGKSRIRMIFSDAWYPHPGPVGLTAKGFTIDVGLEISGTNEQRQPPVSPVDEGVADEPDDLNGSSGVDVVKGDASETFLNDGKFNFRNVEKAWIYTADGKLVKFVQNPTVVAADLANGIYIVKMQNKNVIRSQKVTVK
ncbi:MAG: T9SS type A sorting domain-containing protein, partial [Prevotella sp.]|nr:T9SS type A sorting domain-containing protein [Prevotella sp.]